MLYIIGIKKKEKPRGQEGGRLNPDNLILDSLNWVYMVDYVDLRNGKQRRQTQSVEGQ